MNKDERHSTDLVSCNLVLLNSSKQVNASPAKYKPMCTRKQNDSSKDNKGSIDREKETKKEGKTEKKREETAQ